MISCSTTKKPNRPMLIPSLAVLAGFALLVWGADRFVIGAAATARNMGISPLVIGLTIVGFGTSAPEMLISAMSAWDENPGVAIGNALGSNLANMGLVLGATVLIKPLRVHSGTLQREYPIMFIAMIFALVLVMDSNLSFVDGILLMSALCLVLYWMVRMGRREQDGLDPMAAEYEAELPPEMSTGKALLWLAIGLAILLISSRMVVWGAVDIARTFGVSDLVIGLTIIAIGTSLPELAASIMSAIKGEHDIAIGNVIGSNIFNILGVLGISGIIFPHAIDPDVLSRDFPVMIGLSIALFAMAYGFRKPGSLNRIEGALLLVAYFGYLTVLGLTSSSST